MDNIDIAPVYRNAIWTAIFIQVVTTPVMLLLLDGGRVAKTGGCAMAGFWLGAAFMIWRRPRNPDANDVNCIKWGYPCMLILAIMLSPLIVVFRDWLQGVL